LRVIPDFGFLVRSTAHPALLGLVEWDNGTMSLARFRDKLTQYQEWSASEQGTAQLGRLFELGRIHIYSRYSSGRANQLSEHARYDADTAAEVSRLHSAFEARLKQDAAPGGSVDIVKHMKPAHGRLAGCQRVLAGSQ
jgi:hypothetical protein